MKEKVTLKTILIDTVQLFHTNYRLQDCLENNFMEHVATNKPKSNSGHYVVCPSIYEF